MVNAPRGALIGAGLHLHEPLAQVGLRQLAVDQQHPARRRRPPIQERRSGRHRIAEAERDVGLAGAARAIEHHQALLRDDRIEHHAARRQVEREQVLDVERAQPLAEVVGLCVEALAVEVLRVEALPFEASPKIGRLAEALAKQGGLPALP